MPRHVPPANRRAAAIAAGLAALTGMLALVVAVPIILATAWHVLGPPIPSLGDLTGPDNGTVFVRTLCLIGWLAWTSFTWATLAEALAQWRGWRIPAIGWQQRLAADLIAAVLVLFASPSVVSSVAAPVAAPAATAVHIPADTSANPPAAAPASAQGARPAYTEHHVQAGEQLPALAERYLGDKYRWHAIAAATYGLPQPDGRTLRRGDTRIYPGWTVRIPTTSTLSSSSLLLASDTLPASSHAATAAFTAGADGPAQTTIEYRAREGDWVWYIADRFLGDPDRYPDIAALNPQLAAKYGTAFPDHIEPGDTLRLPADAHDRGPRTHATGTTLPTTVAPAPAARNGPAGTESPSSDAGTVPPAPPATTPPTATPSPSRSEPTTPATISTPAAAVPSATAPATATGTPIPAPHSITPTTDPVAQPAGSHRGIDVGDRGWVTTDLAAAVAALAALAWIQRRRRYRPRPLNPAPRAEADLTPLPAAVATLHAAHPTPTMHPPTAAQDQTSTIEDDMDDPEPHARLAASVTHATLGTDTTGATLRLTDLPGLGVGWTGPGAPDAARGLIVSVLSSGGPWAPAAEAALVTIRHTLTGLLPGIDLGADDDPLRLQAVDTTEQALNELERQLLHRARQAADPDPLPDRPAPAPLVFLADAPTAAAATRLAAILTVGARVGITAVLLGDWPPGETWHLTPDGAITGTDGHTDGTGRRVNILDPTAAAEVLQALREARPGEEADNLAAPTPPPLPAPASPRESPTGAPADHVARRPGHSLRPAHGLPEPTAPHGQHPEAGTGPRLQLRVLGPPMVRVSDGDATTDLRIRRSDGLQLLVYFTVEPAGATSDQLMALLWPNSRPSHSRGRFHTTLSELRRTLVDALGGDLIARTEDRYHLDPTRVDADLWDLAAAIDHASTAVDGAHHAALREVIHRYTGPVAEGHTWLWLDPYRETVRRHVLDAYTALAEAEPDPRAALAIIQDAIRVDPYNENLYQRAMHLHAQLGSTDGIHRTLRTITKRLGELEIPLSPRTQETASRLLERLALRERLGNPTT